MEDTYRASLDIEAAMVAITIMAHIQKGGMQPVNIAVVTLDGQMVHLTTMIGAPTSCRTTTIKKAATAVRHRQPTIELMGDCGLPGGLSDDCFEAGGVPVVIGGVVVAAVGVSGSRTPAEDHTLALHGASLLARAD